MKKPLVAETRVRAFFSRTQQLQKRRASSHAHRNRTNRIQNAMILSILKRKVSYPTLHQVNSHPTYLGTYGLLHLIELL